MSDSRRCPHCSEEQPANSPRGLCPRCLLQQGLELAPEETEQDPCPDGATLVLESGPPSVMARIAMSATGFPSFRLRETEITTSHGATVEPVVLPARERADRPDRYVLLGEIGRGGMGAVLRGRDVDLGRELAVKILLESHKDNPELVRRFVEEARIGGQLQHPGVVPVYELGTFADHRPFFTMELVRGRTLADLLRARESPSDDLPRYLAAFEAVCQTMAYAHARGVIHRDLKPSNIMLGSFGEVQVMDWGLAKVLHPEEGVESPHAGDGSENRPEPPHGPASRAFDTHSAWGPSGGTSSQTGSVLGTPGYMAPEQAAGLVELVDERADVFGLGAILCEILTGRPPGGAGACSDCESDRSRKDLAETAARLGDCGADRELIELAQNCLGIERESRPEHAGIVAARMAAYFASVQDRLRQAELARVEAAARVREEVKQRALSDELAREALARAAEERRRHRLTLALAAAVLALAALGGIGAWIYDYQRKDHATRLESAIQQADSLRTQAEADPNGGVAKWHAAADAARRAFDLLDPLSSTATRSEVSALNDAIAAATRAADRDAHLLEEVADIESSRENDYDGSESNAAYTRAFGEAGYAIDVMGAQVAAAKIRARPAAVALELATALDDWAGRRRKARPGDINRWKQLVAAARAIDPDPMRNELRRLWSLDDRAAQRAPLLELARGVKAEQWPVQSLHRLAVTLVEAGDRPVAIALLQRAQAYHPSDVRITYALARYLDEERPPRIEEATRYYTAARALRPQTAHELAHALERKGQSAEALVILKDLTTLRPQNGRHWLCYSRILRWRGEIALADEAFEHAVAAWRAVVKNRPELAEAHNHLGTVLLEQGKVAEALVEIYESLRLKPTLAQAQENLGNALLAKNRINEAIAAYREAQRLDPDSYHTHFGLGIAFEAQGKMNEAIAEYREAIRMEPDYSEARHNLSLALVGQGKQQEADAEIRETIRRRPDYAEAHGCLGYSLRSQGKFEAALREARVALEIKPNCALAHGLMGLVLQEQGHFREGLVAIRRGYELGLQQSSKPRLSEREVRQAEFIVVIGDRLPAVLRGDDRPKDGREYLEFAGLCYNMRHFGDAARLFAAACESDAGLADPQSGQRYNAACSAALAAAGQGNDRLPLDHEARAHLRSQALDWLKADLAGWTKQAQAGSAGAGARITQTLRHWKSDPDLAGIRDEEPLKTLRDDERKKCQALWTEVDQLLRKASKT
jgi:serine/threonine protein kinase/Flp pilus assembly protein TadD